ncbi:hypothetical protein DPMN_117976 [Dreissena polymorpha]|uniref:VWFD domain-containing protein n=1 Tax=Dreissena polymorpha TaxID=45954 RepID=A0A9D4GG16_DREPO|nr:hypothetical protein DPMN_117976 [Dreissena polymorpha]
MSGSNLVPVSMTSAVGFNINGKKLVIRADDEGTSGTVTLNDEPVAIGSKLNLAPEVNIMMTSTTQYKLTASTDFYLTIDMKKSRLDVYVNAKQSVCSTATGLLSSCDENETNDFKTSIGNVLTVGSLAYPLTETSIEETFVPSWRWDDNIFTNVIPKFNNEGGDTCLEIQCQLNGKSCSNIFHSKCYHSRADVLLRLGNWKCSHSLVIQEPKWSCVFTLGDQGFVCCIFSIQS